jgi:hypothetical protein
VDVAERDTYAPHRNVRVDNATWRPFGEIAGDRARSAWIKDFIEAVVNDAQLWHDLRTIAAARKESVATVLNRALRAYVTRNRHVLSAPTAEQQERA